MVPSMVRGDSGGDSTLEAFRVRVGGWGGVIAHVPCLVLCRVREVKIISACDGWYVTL